MRPRLDGCHAVLGVMALCTFLGCANPPPPASPRTHSLGRGGQIASLRRQGEHWQMRGIAPVQRRPDAARRLAESLDDGRSLIATLNDIGRLSLSRGIRLQAIPHLHERAVAMARELGVADLLLEGCDRTRRCAASGRANP